MPGARWWSNAVVGHGEDQLLAGGHGHEQDLLHAAGIKLSRPTLVSSHREGDPPVDQGRLEMCGHEPDQMGQIDVGVVEGGR